jgi:murein L,D-transpeptidase YafK
MKLAGALALGGLALLAGCRAVVTPDKYAAIDSCLETGRGWDYRSGVCAPVATGPVDRIVVDKSEHWMSVYRGGQLVREFRVALGRGGLGPKQRQGDGRVPEGLYRITTHNPNSAYHLSLRIGYPTPAQLAAARKLGVNAGGDIMIHGLPNDVRGIGSRHTIYDWTEGCVAVTNREIEWLYRAVLNGTPIEIRA